MHQIDTPQLKSCYRLCTYLETSLFSGRFPKWEDLFDAFEKYGTIENMMEVYFEIQRIAALHHKILFEENKYSFFGSGSYLAQDYFLTRIAPYFSEEIFGESYIGEELKKEIDNFVAQYHRGNKIYNWRYDYC